MTTTETTTTAHGALLGARAALVRANYDNDERRRSGVDDLQTYDGLMRRLDAVIRRNVELDAARMRRTGAPTAVVAPSSILRLRMLALRARVRSAAVHDVYYSVAHYGAPYCNGVDAVRDLTTTTEVK